MAVITPTIKNRARLLTATTEPSTANGTEFANRCANETWRNGAHTIPSSPSVERGEIPNRTKSDDTSASTMNTTHIKPNATATGTSRPRVVSHAPRNGLAGELPGGTLPPARVVTAMHHDGPAMSRTFPSIPEPTRGRLLPTPQRANRTTQVWLIAAIALTATMLGGLSPSPAASTVPAPSVSATTIVDTASIQPTAAQTIAPADYLKGALDFIERNALRRANVDWTTIRSTAEARGSKAVAIADTYPIISDTLKALGDPHASFRPPARSTEITQGQANGYGFLATWPDRIVVSLATGGPAQRAGMKLGDRIDLVEGRAPTGSKQVVAIPQTTKTRDTLRVTVSRTSIANGVKRTRRLGLSIVKGAVSLVSTPEQNPLTVRTVGARIGYLDLPGILGTPDDQQRYAASAHAAIKATTATPRCGWILDVRRNRGGWVYPVLAAAGPLIPTDASGLLMGKFDASGVTERWLYRQGEVVVQRPGADPPEYPVFRVANPYVPADAEPVPVAVLASGLSASAGEALVLSLRGRTGVRVFGEATAGLTTFNTVGPLPDGALILVSNAAMVDGFGVRQDGSIKPDETVTPDWNHVGDAADPILSAARVWLETQPACSTVPIPTATP
jgi:carboxyl-terminal processing protease